MKRAKTERNDSQDSLNSQTSSCAPSGCCSGDKSVDVPRRTFLKMTGGALIATSLGRPAVSMAGPFSAKDLRQKHLVPANKRLDPGWIKALYQRGVKEVFSGKSLENIAMPCGGIGTGQLYLCGDGTLGCWQIFNNAVSNWVENTHSTYTHRGIARPVDQGFAVYLKRKGSKPAVKHLSRGGFKEIEFCGKYPVGTVSYKEAGFPITAFMEVFSPYIPINSRESNLPSTLFHVTLRNSSKETLSAGVMGWLENAVCFNYGQQFPTLRKTVIEDKNGRRILTHSALEPPKVKKEPAPKKTRSVIVFEDFEKKDYGKWTMQGTAFGKHPAKGTLQNQNPVSGFKGKGLVNTFYQGDKTRGTLTSEEFTISRHFINFLVGGGGHPEKTCINLVIDGKVILTATGRNNERLAWHSWDVKRFEDKTAQIVIVDNATGGWGHINVDQIEFADKPHADDPVPMVYSADFGTMTLGCLKPLKKGASDAEVIPNGSFADSSNGYISTGDQTYGVEKKMCGLLHAEPVTLKPGEEHTFTFLLAWHFPNQSGGHEYDSRFKNSTEVAQYIFDNHERLSRDTRLWRDTFYNSTLPYWLLDRLHSTASYLATGTCQWWKNGRFWAYEGVSCCNGTCTHVWNYAHGHARLFPALARTIREMQDFSPREKGGGFHPDTGLVGFRSNDSYAADGQCGTILKAYREHLMSADYSFLKRNWKSIKKALMYSISRDGNSDGLIEDSQHNTYDINYYGANTFVGSLYLAALHAGEAMACEMGDLSFARLVKTIYDSGCKLSLERLWNGEYFTQEVDLKVHPEHQYEKGCLSDHLFGQGWAHQVGLGYIYPEDKVKSAMKAVWNYNWAPDITPYNKKHKPFRWFISSGQAGLFTCTWPKGGYLTEGTVYKNEVWTGIEYQVAGHMIWEGMVEEGLAICRAVHDRYHPDLINPYNEVECGDHYARALASWGVYLALCGFEYHGPKGHIGFAPRITPESFQAAFTAAEGWGTFSQNRKAKCQQNRIALRWGKLRLKFIALAVEKKLPVSVRVSGKRIEAKADFKKHRVLLTLEHELTLKAGQTLEVVFS